MAPRRAVTASAPGSRRRPGLQWSAAQSRSIPDYALSDGASGCPGCLLSGISFLREVTYEERGSRLFHNLKVEIRGRLAGGENRQARQLNYMKYRNWYGARGASRIEFILTLHEPLTPARLMARSLGARPTGARETCVRDQGGRGGRFAAPSRTSGPMTEPSSRAAAA
jgi:hypothetical protein